ncbi:hypothetical protein DPMN_106866 [Dreissena polymorpha]|uniref:Uncharacterized protein n=1 Tax=Dreissena polymorpha TaxID=45954 RepID=A0A9D4K5T2_DREPO|nr:hypothetical protein DPMN_106866 [Dreissena polymorpha]
MDLSERYPNLKVLFSSCLHHNEYDASVVDGALREFHSYLDQLNSYKTAYKLTKIERAIEALQSKDDETFTSIWSDAQKLFREHLCVASETKDEDCPQENSI